MFEHIESDGQRCAAEHFIARDRILPRERPQHMPRVVAHVQRLDCGVDRRKRSPKVGRRGDRPATLSREQVLHGFVLT